MMTFGSLFAGIGGFDLGLERAGMQCQWQVEIDPYCQRVLVNHWPNVKRYGDIRECGKHNLSPVDLICGGFPCQPFSVAGKQRGKADDRYLWPEMLRVIREVRPRWVLGENVAGIINMELDTVLADLEAEGYEVQTFVIPACGVDAPHRRDRVWIVGYASWTTSEWNTRSILGAQTSSCAERKQDGDLRIGLADAGQDVADSFAERLSQPKFESSEERTARTSERPCSAGGSQWPVEPQLGRVAHGVPKRVDRLKCLGNSVVPQVVEVIGRAILECERFHKPA